jgi:hypothetical protein
MAEYLKIIKDNATRQEKSPAGEPAERVGSYGFRRGRPSSSGTHLRSKTICLYYYDAKMAKKFQPSSNSVK